MKRTLTVNSAMAAEVLEHHFGKRPRRVERLHGGLANHVFQAKVGAEEVVVRIAPDAAKMQTFLKEQWAVRTARANHVPAPEVLEVGNTAIAYPYMILLKAPGVEGMRWPDREGLARQMGALAAKVNSVPTSGFGPVFEWSHNQLSQHQTWRDYLDEEIQISRRIDVLGRQRMLAPEYLKRLEKRAKELRAWKGRPHLTHGDLRFKNVILDPRGKVKAVLDWEHCSSNLAPHWELSISLHDLSLDEKEAFLEGYGIKPKEYAKMAPWVNALNVLNYAFVIEEALKKNQREHLEYLRVRLRGAFDFLTL